MYKEHHKIKKRLWLRVQLLGLNII